MSKSWKKENSLLARFSLPKCWGLFASGMAIIVWCYSAEGVVRVGSRCKKFDPPWDRRVGRAILSCIFECKAPETMMSMTRDVIYGKQNSVRSRRNIVFPQDEALHHSSGVESSSSALYPFLECSSAPAGIEALGGQVELDLFPISTWNYKRIIVKNFQALTLVAHPFHAIRKVLEVLQFENVGTLDLSWLVLDAPHLSLKILHSRVIFSESSWSIRIGSLAMINVSAHVLPLTMGQLVGNVYITGGTFNFTFCPVQGFVAQQPPAFKDTSAISIMDSYIHTMFECKYSSRISIGELQMRRVRIVQIQQNSLWQVIANNVIFKTCDINRLQYGALNGLQANARFGLEECNVGWVDSYGLWGISTAYPNSATIEVLRTTFSNVAGPSSFSVSGSQKLISEQNEAHLSSCSCAMFQEWMWPVDGTTRRLLPLEQVVCDPRTEKEAASSAEDFLCHKLECFPASSNTHCSIHGLSGSVDNYTQLRCSLYYRESPYLATTWFPDVLKHAANCKRIKEFKIEKIGSLALNFTWPPYVQRRADNFPLNELTFPQLDILEIRDITNVIFSAASRKFVQCCKRIIIDNMLRISFNDEISNGLDTESINYLEINSLGPIIGETKGYKPYVRLEFLNTNRHYRELKMKISCCRNFSIERDFDLTQTAISNLVKDCLRNCKSEDVTCVEEQFTSGLQEGDTTSNRRPKSEKRLWNCSFFQSKIQGPAIVSNNTFIGPHHSLKGIIIQAHGTLILQAGAIRNLTVSSRITLQNIPDLQLEDYALQTSPANPKLNIRIRNCTVTKFQEVFGIQKASDDQGTLPQQARVKRSLLMENVDVKAPLPTFHLWTSLAKVTFNFSSIASFAAGSHSADLPTNSLGDKYLPSSGTFERLRILNSDVKVIETNAASLDHAEALAIVNSSIGLMMKNAIQIGDLQMLRLENNMFFQVESRALRVKVSGNVILSNNNIVHPSGIMPFEIMIGKKTNLESVDKLELGNGSCSCASMVPDPAERSSKQEGENPSFTPGFLQMEFKCQSPHGTMIPASQYLSTNCAQVWSPYILLILLVPILIMVVSMTSCLRRRRAKRGRMKKAPASKVISISELQSLSPRTTPTSNLPPVPDLATVVHAGAIAISDRPTSDNVYEYVEELYEDPNEGLRMNAVCKSSKCESKEEVTSKSPPKTDTHDPLKELGALAALQDECVNDFYESTTDYRREQEHEDVQGRRENQKFEDLYCEIQVGGDMDLEPVDEILDSCATGPEVHSMKVESQNHPNYDVPWGPRKREKNGSEDAEGTATYDYPWGPKEPVTDL